MEKDSSAGLIFIAGIVLAIGGGYAFVKFPGGGVNARTVVPFAALLAGIVMAILGKTRMAEDSERDLAAGAGLKVKGGLALTDSERVEMEGDFDGFRVSVSRRETRSRGGGGTRSEQYVFFVELTNPAGISFYVGSDSLFQTPLGFLPPKLESSAWEWADMLAVRGAPAGMIETFFSADGSRRLFLDFFRKVGYCRLDNGKMEFDAGRGAKSGGGPGEDFLTAAEVKGLILQAVELARLVAALPPSGPIAG